MISAIGISEAAEAATVRQRFYDDFNIEIDASLGPLKARSGRGIGHGAGWKNVELLAEAPAAVTVTQAVGTVAKEGNCGADLWS